MLSSLHRNAAVFLLCSLAMVGCASHRAALPTTVPGGVRIDSVLAVCFPPAGWTAEPLKKSDRHAHQIWISPSHDTAYGVAHFSLPLPVTADMALWFFLREMKRTEGVANLLGKRADSDLPGLRFEAVGGLYHVRGNLIVHGWQGWVIYAATRANGEVDGTELENAIFAREATTIIEP